MLVKDIVSKWWWGWSGSMEGKYVCVVLIKWYMKCERWSVERRVEVIGVEVYCFGKGVCEYEL